MEDKLGNVAGSFIARKIESLQWNKQRQKSSGQQRHEIMRQLYSVDL
jgi:hypothetical protein